MTRPAEINSRVASLERQLASLTERLQNYVAAPAEEIRHGLLLVKVTLDTALTAGGSVPVTVQDWSGSADSATAEFFTAHDTLLGSISGAAGDPAVVVKLPGRGGRWEFVAVKSTGGIRRALLTEDLDAMGTAEAVLYSPSETVTVVDYMNHPVPSSRDILVAFINDEWVLVRAFYTTFEQICDIECDPLSGLVASVQDERRDYTVAPCIDPLAISAEPSDLDGINIELLSASFPPEILTEYVNVAILAAVYTTPAVTGNFFTVSGYSSPAGP